MPSFVSIEANAAFIADEAASSRRCRASDSCRAVVSEAGQNSISELTVILEPSFKVMFTRCSVAPAQPYFRDDKNGIIRTFFV